MPKKWFEKKPIFALAPMADYTDQPFSLLCREISGNEFVVFREMVSAEAIVRGNRKTLKMCEIDRRERPVILQIFGDKPEIMAAAAKIIDQEFRPDGLDVNMGCPVPKIAQKSRAGAALMKYPELAAEIISAIRAVKLSCPLSVKTRLGWSDPDEIFEFAPAIVAAGAELLTLHARTKIQGYSGRADWERITALKKLITVPLIANGDVRSAADIESCLRVTKADGVMIGRGALGNPWIFASEAKGPAVSEIVAALMRHGVLQTECYGERGMVALRKHLPWYFHGERALSIKDIKKIRARLVRISGLGELRSILSSL